MEKIARRANTQTPVGHFSDTPEVGVRYYAVRTAERLRGIE